MTGPREILGVDRDVAVELLISNTGLLLQQLSEPEKVHAFRAIENLKQLRTPETVARLDGERLTRARAA